METKLRPYNLDIVHGNMYDLDNVPDNLYNMDIVPGNMYDLDNVPDNLYNLQLTSYISVFDVSTQSWPEDSRPPRKLDRGEMFDQSQSVWADPIWRKGL